MRHVYVCMSDDSARVFMCLRTGPDAPLSPPFITDKSVFAVIPQIDATCSPVTVQLSRVSPSRCTF